MRIFCTFSPSLPSTSGSTSIIKLANCLTVCASLWLLLALPSAAHAGDYVVRLTNTNGAHWSSFGANPFLTLPGRINSGKGSFSPGNYRSWRARVLGTGSQIVGGRMRVGVTTFHKPMRGRIVVGSSTLPVVVHEEFGTGGIERTLPMGNWDWVQFDLSSTGNVTTSQAGLDSIVLHFAELTLRDSVAPTAEILHELNTPNWYSADACVPYNMRFTDQGSGIGSIELKSLSTGHQVLLDEPQLVESTRPGPTERAVSGCISPEARRHGDNTILATVRDVSGIERKLGFNVRADHEFPSVSSWSIAEAEKIQSLDPAISFDVSDTGSGIASIEALLDGTVAPITIQGSRVTIQHEPLKIGTHEVAITVVDGAGNSSRFNRAFHLVDLTPPSILLTSPGARGDSSISIIAEASDAMSGVNPSTWSLLIDDAQSAFTIENSQLRSTINDLEVGSHNIKISVYDNAGNRGSITHTYTVPIPPPPPPSAQAQAAPPERSGTFLIDSPRSAVAFGRSATVTVQVIREGDPVTGQRVTVRRDTVELAASATDSDGMARIRVPGAKPGTFDAVAEGMGFEPVTIPLRIAPRTTITVSSSAPKVGQRVRVAGRIFPALRARTVSVEARVAGVWFPVRKTTKTNISGRFSTTVVSTTPGPIHIRVKLKPKGAWSGAISNVRLLRVRSR